MGCCPKIQGGGVRSCSRRQTDVRSLWKRSIRCGLRREQDSWQARGAMSNGYPQPVRAAESGLTVPLALPGENAIGISAIPQFRPETASAPPPLMVRNHSAAAARAGTPIPLVERDFVDPGSRTDARVTWRYGVRPQRAADSARLRGRPRRSGPPDSGPCLVIYVPETTPL